VTLDLKLGEKFSRTLSSAFDATGRSHLFSVAAENLHRLVTSHILRIEPKHHKWANLLGAAPTRHFAFGVAASAFSHTPDAAVVTIPVPGFNRAFRDVAIYPKNWTHLTVPVSSHSYGHRAAELRRMGWRIFRPKDHDILMGYRKGEKATTLYALKKSVTQRQDRSLLPQDAEMVETVKAAVRGEIERIRSI